MISQKTPIPGPNGWAMGISRVLLGENRPQYIESALYNLWAMLDAVQPMQSTFEM